MPLVPLASMRAARRVEPDVDALHEIAGHHLVVVLEEDDPPPELGLAGELDDLR